MGEIFHDHYRVYNKDNSDIPLLEQMLKFYTLQLGFGLSLLLGGAGNTVLVHVALMTVEKNFKNCF